MPITRLNNNSITSVTALPSGLGGKVLQVKAVTDTDGFVTTSTSYASNDTMELSFTATNANTKAYILLTSGIRANNDQMEATVFAKINSGSYSNIGVTSRSSFINMYSNFASNRTMSGAGSIIHTFSNSVGDTIYCKVYVKCHSGNNGNLTETQPSTLTIFEYET